VAAVVTEADCTAQSHTRGIIDPEGVAVALTGAACVSNTKNATNAPSILLHPTALGMARTSHTRAPSPRVRAIIERIPIQSEVNEKSLGQWRMRRGLHYSVWNLAMNWRTRMAHFCCAVQQAGAAARGSFRMALLMPSSQSTWGNPHARGPRLSIRPTHPSLSAGEHANIIDRAALDFRLGLDPSNAIFADGFQIQVTGRTIWAMRLQFEE
jgi:hypothetical protein